MIEVLSVTSEAWPLVKTGGLADVAGALPAALKPHGVTMRTLIPGYPEVMARCSRTREAGTIKALFGGKAVLRAGKIKGLNVIVLDAPHLYDRKGGLYVDAAGADWPDNWKRFAALGFVGAALAREAIDGYRPAVVHAHDWQGAMAPVYLRYGGGGAKTVLTVHNLAFQGQFGADIFSQLKLPPAANALDGVEYYGGVGFLKGGLASADAITTVSPTYAREIRTAEFGMGLDGVLNARVDDLIGIPNGIDTGIWDPENDENLAAPYTASRVNLRAANKRALEERFGLDRDDGPLFAAVTRMTWQKGIDLLAEAADRLVHLGGRLAVLGSGDPVMEADMQAAAARHPGRVGVVAGYDEALSHLIQGGADAIVIPSRFEPCGLTQLYGLRYGCVPVVSRVGGLNDTIIDANDAAVDAGVATGIQFAPVTAAGLGDALARAVALYARPDVWRKMQRRGMKADVSWTRSAARYAALYEKLTEPEDQ